MPILKVVIDTSVMVSVAFAKEGLAKELKKMISDGSFTLVTSKAIIKELYKVLHYPHITKRFKPSKRDIDEFTGIIIEQAQITEGLYTVNRIEDDPTDDMFLSCALEGNADYIISRDPHLRNIKHYHGIQIVDVKSFMDKVRGK